MNKDDKFVGVSQDDSEVNGVVGTQKQHVVSTPYVGIKKNVMDSIVSSIPSPSVDKRKNVMVTPMVVPTTHLTSFPKTTAETKSYYKVVHTKCFEQ